jgi:hypothetical protein
MMQYGIDGDRDPVSPRIKFPTKKLPFNFRRARIQNQIDGVLFVTTGCAQGKFLNLTKERECLFRATNRIKSAAHVGASIGQPLSNEIEVRLKIG